MNPTLPNLAALIVLIGRALLVVAGFAALGALVIAIRGPWLGGVMAGAYAFSFGATSVVVMAFGKVIPVLIQIEENTATVRSSESG